MKSKFLLLVLLSSLISSPIYAQSTPPQIFNVVDYGAIPNDDIDDTDAINAAIAAASDLKWNYNQNTYNLRGNQVHIPSGIFIVKGLVIWNAYTKLKGSGPQSTILKLQNSSSPVIHLKGAAYTEIEDLTLDGGDTASYGILADDIGYIAEYEVDFASVGTALTNVIIRRAKGSPGIGFANVDRAHSTKFSKCIIRENNIGIKLIKRAQHSIIEKSGIYFNQNQQIILGDGGSFIRDITINESDIEGTNTGTSELIRVDGVSPLNINEIYFEGHRTKNAVDITTVNLPSNISIHGLYSNGGASTMPTRSILLKTKTTLSMDNANYVNTSKVYEIGSPEGNPTYAKPTESKIIITSSSGPGISKGSSINQGGASWEDGTSLTQGNHTWDMVVGNDGVLYFGYNKKTKMALTPFGEVKTFK